jgi:cytochrome c-type biogenesis protein
MSGAPLPIVAFTAGILSFLSPCVLPLVPGYVALISGTSVEELSIPEPRLTRTLMVHSMMFIVGFSIVFVALGAVATTMGQITHQYHAVLTRLAGAVIIVFGLHLTGIWRIKAFYADKRIHQLKGDSSPLGAFAVGFAFAFGWTPCIGPILAAILALVASEETALKGVGLLAVYSLGLAVPFLLTSLGVDRFLSFYGRFKRHLHTVEVASGVLLILVGALVFTRHFAAVSDYLSFLNRFAL